LAVDWGKQKHPLRPLKRQNGCKMHIFPRKRQFAASEVFERGMGKTFFKKFSPKKEKTKKVLGVPGKSFTGSFFPAPR
jgi:hypothetical protein